MTTTLTLIRARRMPSGPVTFYAFDESSRRDAEALARLRIASPDRRECRVTVDFDPAGSAALNVPVRELVTAERDRLRVAIDFLYRAVIDHHGCFPNDVATPEQRALRAAMLEANRLIPPSTPEAA